ncbi:MAG: hypothetical protein EAZ53_06700 [Bacteroidetes bacterium]|nr:MAG: hypothetical protein EAZ53_06700 [Bacteroidota bacterium]
MIKKANAYDTTHFPSALIGKVGKGKLGMVFYNMSWSYEGRKSNTERDFLFQILNELDSTQTLNIIGSRYLHSSLMKNNNNNNIYVHLINTGGEHNSIHTVTYDTIPPITNIKIKLKVETRPKTVLLQPRNREVNYTYFNNSIEAEIPKIDLYEILEVKF